MHVLFGCKEENMKDKKYCDFLDPKDFMASFQLYDTAILGEIRLINPNCASLQAELNKLSECFFFFKFIALQHKY